MVAFGRAARRGAFDHDAGDPREDLRGGVAGDHLVVAAEAVAASIEDAGHQAARAPVAVDAPRPRRETISQDRAPKPSERVKRAELETFRLGEV